jgi:hypothetical protein
MSTCHNPLRDTSRRRTWSNLFKDQCFFYPRGQQNMDFMERNLSKENKLTTRGISFLVKAPKTQNIASYHFMYLIVISYIQLCQRI